MLKKIFNFYKEGFLSMKTGKKLWIIIGIKLFIMFAILKIFFFNDFLSSKFDNDKDKGDYVIEQLTNINK
ncbi:MAG: DUF4492 domain-containing protein [Chlorobi bacterium]|nr:DUF4492 domain-containing protein [Chlorobiota bacterium]